MKTWTFGKLMMVMSVALLTFTSCDLVWKAEDDMDFHKSVKVAGQWTGDFGMYYNYRYNGRLYTFDSYDTDIVFYPDYDGATYGYGKQVDYYEQGPYSRIYNSFDWEIRRGVIYMQYRQDSSLDCTIHDYDITSDRFYGRFGNSKDKFYLSKIADYYDWTIYMDYYFFYPRNNWRWSPLYSIPVQNSDSSNDLSGTRAEAETENMDGMVSFGRRF